MRASDMQVKKKPLVIVTRKLPDCVETRMRELFDARLNLDDRPMTADAHGGRPMAAEMLVPDRYRPYRRRPADRSRAATSS